MCVGLVLLGFFPPTPKISYMEIFFQLASVAKYLPVMFLSFPLLVTWVVIIYFISENPAKVKGSVSHCSDVRLSSGLKAVIVLTAQRRSRTISSWRSLQLEDATGGPSSLAMSLLCLFGGVSDNKKLLWVSEFRVPVSLPMVLTGSSATWEMLLILEQLTNWLQVYWNGYSCRS